MRVAIRLRVGVLIFLLIAGACDTETGGSDSALPSVSLNATPASGPNDRSFTLSWSAKNATACLASNAWSGTKGPSGSERLGPLTVISTFSLSCSGTGGSAEKSVTVMIPSAGPLAGLEFPGSAAVKNGDTIRFRFLNPLAAYPATYIWRAYPRQQAGYYTAFFWGNDTPTGLGGDLGTFLWINSGSDADTYYGAHPYPRGSPTATKQDWEISVERADYVNGVVVYDRWYTQALRVWIDSSGSKHHEFYWDLPNTDASHMVSRTSPSSWGNRQPPVPVLTWGDAPWAPGNEVWDGMLRGFQVYNTALSVADILAEAISPLSTSNGATNVWYLNLNPTPADIADKSGRGHNPSWVGNLRPRLWTQRQ